MNKGPELLDYDVWVQDMSYEEMWDLLDDRDRSEIIWEMFDGQYPDNTEGEDDPRYEPYKDGLTEEDIIDYALYKMSRSILHVMLEDEYDKYCNE